MRTKWYISISIIILTLIGAICEQQISVPNQEIVLQFTNTDVTAEDTQNALDIVKNQLQSIGVENIQVKKQESGNITITYYSDEDVAKIKQTLSKESNLALGYSPFSQDHKGAKLPSEKNNIGYNLDVHEIQNNHDVDWGFNGKYVLEAKSKSNTFINPSISMSTGNVGIGNKNEIERVAYKINRNIAIAIDHSSHNIPEVRAGPHS